MFDVFFDKASKLNEKGEPFALAIVVRYEAPSSGKTGDKAIIKQDGSIEGWIGGGCTQPVVIKEALHVLADGLPRLVRIAPSHEDKTEGIVAYPMTCHSGGALDVYIEPIFPKPHLVIFGKSVVAQTLARLAQAIHYRVTLVTEDDEPRPMEYADQVLGAWNIESIIHNRKTYAIIATQGEGDEEALLSVAAKDWGYAAFVASRRKASEVYKSLAQKVVAERLKALRVPAGLDIKARLPEEIAVSILAEIIEFARTHEIAIERAGQTISASYRSEVLTIQDMSCAHCVATVEKVLKSVPGVEVGNVEIGSAEVAYNPDTVRKETIETALRKRGYALVS